MAMNGPFYLAEPAPSSVVTLPYESNSGEGWPCICCKIKFKDFKDYDEHGKVHEGKVILHRDYLK